MCAQLLSLDSCQRTPPRVASYSCGSIHHCDAMKVKIVHNSQKLFNINVTEKTTIKDLKQAISRNIGLPPEDQVLTVRGIFLEDEHSLGDYRLPKPDMVAPIVLYQRASYRKPTSIRVSVSADKTVYLSICLDSKVSELRSAIEEKLNISTNETSEMRLIFDHWILEDSEVLEHYGIKKNSCIVVARRFVGSPLNDAEEHSKKLSRQSDVVPKIRLNIMTRDGEVFDFSFVKKVTLCEVVGEIERKTGIPAAHQIFTLREDLPHVTDLTKSLEELGLNDGDTVYLADARSTNNEVKRNAPQSPSSTTMVLHFRDRQNAFSIPMSHEATVQDAMDSLRREISGNPGPLWLKNTVDGNYMQDYGTRLSDLGLKDGMTIEYVYLPAKTEWTSK
ncbi:Polyubiquitin [Echinococcus granulosus]|uniref:Polyubiquitin C n=2 Tax=Echinococcus granulosus TaxID=6210 RepID=A0A068W815_ECHGR|nr:Polyubiquitin [Echinococcus granulosus]CDS15574.1 polyubiquitin C [Echinococcus granulosus]